jgi:catechol 2,3-dioxygenase-like lactoylglutathione lyase family enzyme
MFNGVHVLLYSKDPEADRAFFRDVLNFPAVDVGHGWLIFAMPAAEAAIHPTNGGVAQEHGGRELLGAVVYFMCEDLKACVKTLAAKKIHCTPISEEAWGIKTTIPLPSGGEVGLYQPKHMTALGLRPA